MFVKLKDYSYCHGYYGRSFVTGASFPPAKYRLPSLKNIARNRQSSDPTFLVGLRLFPQDIPLDPTTLEFLSEISLKPDTFEVGGGGVTTSCPFGGESFSVHTVSVCTSCASFFMSG